MITTFPAKSNYMSSDDFGILIVDDEPNIRAGLKRGLLGEADRLATAEHVDEALQIFGTGDFHLVIADVRLNGRGTGLDLMKSIHESSPTTCVIVITAHGTVELAVEAMRSGAFDFILKPLDLSLLRQQVRKAREFHRLQLENLQLRTRLAGAGEISNIIGNSTAMQSIYHQIRQVAGTEATVLVQGESGTGKELIARAIHDLSERSSGPFVAVNLGALPESLLESELFGYEKGSFSGANRQKPGCFEQAFGGTLFLDEVTEMPAKSQVDLLRVLETRQFRRIGGEEILSSDVRIVSATNRRVHELIDDGSFREDLYYRLNIIPIELPALRERREDIPLLLEHFLKHFCTRHHRPDKSFSEEAMQILTNATWPGNVRQLRNVVERLVVTHPGDVIHSKDLPHEVSLRQGEKHQLPRSLSEAVAACERETITMFLEAYGLHREKTAKALGISVRTLHYKMGRYGLH